MEEHLIDHAKYLAYWTNRSIEKAKRPKTIFDRGIGLFGWCCSRKAQEIADVEIQISRSMDGTGPGGERPKSLHLKARKAICNLILLPFYVYDL